MSVWIFLGAIFKYWLYFPPVIPVGVLAALWKRFCTLVNNMAISLWVLTTYGWVSSSFGVVVFILLILTAVSASLETLTKKLKLWKPLLNSRTQHKCKGFVSLHQVLLYIKSSFGPLESLFLTSEERTDSFVFSCFNGEARGHYVLTLNLSVCNSLYFPLLGTFLCSKFFSFQFRYFDSQCLCHFLKLFNLISVYWFLVIFQIFLLDVFFFPYIIFWS